MSVKRIAKRGEPLPQQPQVTLEECQDEIAILRMTNKRLQAANQELQKKASAYDTIIDRHMSCTQLTRFVFAWLRLLRPFSQTSCFVGGFIRQLFTFIFDTPRIQKSNWCANPLTTPLQCILQPVEGDKGSAMQSFLQCISNIQNCRNDPTYNIASFSIEAIHHNQCKGAFDLQECPVPNISILCKSGQTKIELQLFAWIPRSVINLSTNSLRLGSDGISSFIFGMEFLQTTEHILEHEVTYLRNPDQIQMCAFPPNGVSHDVKRRYLDQMVEILLASIEQMETDYTFCGRIPHMYIERKEECTITGCKAPYAVCKLQCGHSVSIMAYKGLTSIQSHESTESIKCPICRAPLLLQFCKRKDETVNQANGSNKTEECAWTQQRFRNMSPDAVQATFR